MYTITVNILLSQMYRSQGPKTLQDRRKRLQKAPKTLKISKIADVDESQKLCLKSQNEKGGRAAVIPLGVALCRLSRRGLSRLLDPSPVLKGPEQRAG